jgi:hypothetical protein
VKPLDSSMVYSSISPPEDELSIYSDVFMFGLLLFEVLTRYIFVQRCDNIRNHPGSDTWFNIIPRMECDSYGFVGIIKECCTV